MHKLYVIIISVIMVFSIQAKADPQEDLFNQFLNGVPGDKQAQESKSDYLDDLLSKADAGEMQAQETMAGIYASGAYNRIPKDLIKAKHYYLLAAKQGSVEGQVYTARLFQMGVFGKPDMAQAIYWYNKAAKQGHIKSARIVGDAYLIGGVVEKNPEKATKYIAFAARGGDEIALFRLGNFYLNGTGVPQDYAKAIKMFQLSSKRGFVPANDILGQMYERGAGAQKDLEIAFEWYIKGAWRSHPAALMNVGRFRASGMGSKKSIPHGYMWVYFASKVQAKGAVEYLQKIQEQMTDADWGKAKELIERCERMRKKRSGRFNYCDS